MNSNIPIIALTADVTTIDADKARAVGMNDYISKPIDEQLLYSKIIDVLQNRMSKFNFKEEQIFSSILNI
jgi:CheY-like chemotaxis protein